jgi:hypothetical protein
MTALYLATASMTPKPATPATNGSCCMKSGGRSTVRKQANVFMEVAVFGLPTATSQVWAGALAPPPLGHASVLSHMAWAWLRCVRTQGQTADGMQWWLSGTPRMCAFYAVWDRRQATDGGNPDGAVVARCAM